MSDASDRGWGDPGTPGTASAVVYRKQRIVTIDVGGIKLAVRREAAPLFAGFIQAITTHAPPYLLAEHADDWGYICRYIRGYEAERILSNHSWGLAIDLNATSNPMTSDNRVHTDMPVWVIDEARHWGLSWGGDYSGQRKDPMHFEVLLTRNAVEQLVAIHEPDGPAAHPSDEEADLTPEQQAQLDRIEKMLLAMNHEIAAPKDGRLFRVASGVDRLVKKLGA